MRHHYYHFFFFNDTATTEIYTLSLHDALPIYAGSTKMDNLLPAWVHDGGVAKLLERIGDRATRRDRKSTRLNSSHSQISYAVFCLKKKKGKADHRWTRARHHRTSHQLLQQPRT